MKVTQNHIRQIKRHLSANGSILLPLALKWRLFYTAIGTLALLILSGMASHRVYATSITLEVPEKLSLTAKPDGQFHSSETPAVVKITSDAIAGYTFTMSGTGGSNALINGDYNIPSITVPIESSAFKANAWGYQISKAGATAGTKFQPGPTSNTQIDTTIEANAEAVQYSFTLGAMVDGTIPAGSYSNTFTLMVTANPVPYAITYHENGKNVIDVPQNESGNAAEGAMIMIGAEPTRQGYAFVGWCTAQTSDETCNDGYVYPSGYPYVLTNSSNTLNLYAMWTVSNPIQNWNGCSTLDVHQMVYLVDSRDNNVYKVRKLKDGQCWMVENLRLGSDQIISLTKQDISVKQLPSSVKLLIRL